MTNSFSYSTHSPPKKIGVLAERNTPYKADQANVELNDIQSPIIHAPPEVREIIERVLRTEKDKLYMKPPRHINDDILKIIKDVIHQ